MKRPLLKLVKRGELLPSGKKIVAPLKSVDGTRERKSFEILLPESREIVGYLYVEDDGRVSYEAVNQDDSYRSSIQWMVDECNSCGESEKDTDCPWTPETRALHLTGGMGNLAYSNPRWEQLDWGEETIAGDPN
jgi:hypothetical protein